MRLRLLKLGGSRSGSTWSSAQQWHKDSSFQCMLLSPTPLSIFPSDQKQNLKGGTCVPPPLCWVVHGGCPRSASSDVLLLKGTALRGSQLGWQKRKRTHKFRTKRKFLHRSWGYFNVFMILLQCLYFCSFPRKYFREIFAFLISLSVHLLQLHFQQQESVS